MDSGTLSELWTLQSYVEPRYGIRIISVYSCDAHLEERSDIFSHRFRPVPGQIIVPIGEKKRCIHSDSFYIFAFFVLGKVEDSECGE